MGRGVVRKQTTLTKCSSSDSASSTCETLFNVGRDNAALGDCNVTVACKGGNEKGKEDDIVQRGSNRLVNKMTDLGYKSARKRAGLISRREPQGS